MEINYLINIAKSFCFSKKIGTYVRVGEVSAALVSKSGKIYTGISIELPCGMGFCAEHSAIAEMLKSGEEEIDMIVAVNKHGILPPCGRCREFMRQINVNNYESTNVIISEQRVVKLGELLPYPFA